MIWYNIMQNSQYFFCVFLPDKGFLLSRNMLHYNIQYTNYVRLMVIICVDKQNNWF